MSNCICQEFIKTFGVHRPECPANHDKLLAADLAIARAELGLNKKLLARQCDLAREAETKFTELQRKVRTFKELFDSCDNLTAMFHSMEDLFAAVDKL